MGSRAVWVLAGAVAVVALIALALGAQPAAFVLAMLLATIAAARWLWRRERPEGLAVRSWPVDVFISVVLAVAIAVLAMAPGV